MFTVLHKSLAVWKHLSAWLLLGPLLLLLTAERLDWIYRHYSAAGAHYAICADWATMLFFVSLLPCSFFFAVKRYAKSKIPLYLFPSFMVLILCLLYHGGLAEKSEIFFTILVIVYFILCVIILILPFSGSMQNGFKWGVAGKLLLGLLIAPLYIMIPIAVLLRMVTDAPRLPGTISPHKVYRISFANRDDGSSAFTIRRVNGFCGKPATVILNIPGPAWKLTGEWSNEETCQVKIPGGTSLKIFRKRDKWHGAIEKTLKQDENHGR